MLAALALGCGHASGGVALENHPTTRPVGSRSVLATIHRSQCYGQCPVYTASISDDGRVVWEGEEFVAVVGHAEAQIPVGQVGQLRAAFERAGFDKLNDDYTREDMTDMPSATLTFRYTWGVKKVQHYHGDQGAPKGLDTLEEAFDQIVGTRRWIGAQGDDE